MDWLSNLWWALKIAAVVFAVMVGGFTGHILASVLGLKRARLPVVVLGALLAGLAVWLALNRVGGTGWGFGGGGGGGFGSGSGTGLAGTARGTGRRRASASAS